MSNLNPIYLEERNSFQKFVRKANPFNSRKLRKAKEARQMADDLRERLPEYNTSNSAEIFKTGQLRATRHVPHSTIDVTLHSRKPISGRLPEDFYMYRSTNHDGPLFGRETTENITGPIRRIK